MPPLPPVPNVVLVRLKGTLSGSVWNNIMHLQYTGAAPTVADLNTIGTSISTAWNTNFAPLATSAVTLTGIDLADLTNPAAAATSVTANVPGTRAGTAMAAQVCCVVSWVINVRYRGGHPRSYFPFGSNTDIQTVRTWTTAFVTAVNNGSTAFRTALNALTVSGTTYKMCTVSYVRNNAPRNPPIVFTIQSNVVHGRIDTQRRRLGKETP